MRFPRNAKIFRGQIDAAPLAGIFFLLVVFLLLASLIYTPGIPIQISANAAGTSGARKNISITKEGAIVFANQTYKTNAMEQLRANLKKLPPQTTLVLETFPNAPRELVEQVRDMARIFDLGFETAGVGIELPSSENILGTTNPTVVVAINIAGQYFFENQLISEAQLKSQLAIASQARSPLTLVVLADKGVQYEAIVRLTQLAERAGIKQALLQQRPVAAKTPR
jgi:biopolymer transport protein ExbD